MMYYEELHGIIMSNTDDIVDTIKKRNKMAKERKKRLTGTTRDLKIPTGNTLIDIMLEGGLELKTMAQFYGAHSSGKTEAALEVIAQAKKKFGEKLHVRYIDSEGGMKFNTKKMYNFSFDDTPQFERVGAKTVNDFIALSGSFIRKLPSGDVGIVILDSLDATGSKESADEYDERIKKHDKGEDHERKSMQMEKQKFLAAQLPILLTEIEANNVLFIAISHQKEKVGVTFGSTEYTTGGASPGFYSSDRLRFKVISDPSMILEGRSVGSCVEVWGKKTRTPYPFRTVYMPTILGYGIDDVGGNVDFLYDLRPIEGALKGKLDVARGELLQWNSDPNAEVIEELSNDDLKDFLEAHNVLDEYKIICGRFSAKKAIAFINEYEELDLKSPFVEKFGVLSREMLVSYIEENGLEDELAKRVTEKWMSIENRIKPKRKGRFS